MASSYEIGPCEHGSWRDSALHLYLPEGLILKLITEVITIILVDLMLGAMSWKLSCIPVNLPFF